jgi:hypothetical protein
MLNAEKSFATEISSEWNAEDTSELQQRFLDLACDLNCSKKECFLHREVLGRIMYRLYIVELSNEIASKYSIEMVTQQLQSSFERNKAQIKFISVEQKGKTEKYFQVIVDFDDGCLCNLLEKKKNSLADVANAIRKKIEGCK